MAFKIISFRFDAETLDKLHYVANYEGRSVNGQINHMVRKLIENFEKEHGEITFGREKN